MVKSYDRYEQEKCFGVITSQSNIVWLPPAESQSSKSSGRALTSGLEEILVWDIKTGDLLQRLQDGLVPGASNAPTSQPPSAVSFLAYNQPSNIVASGYNDGSVKIWDLSSGSVIIKFHGHRSRISILKFDTSGTRLVTGSNDGSIILWDLVGEEGLFKLTGHKNEITDLTFLSKGSRDIDELDDYIISVSKDGLIKLWELSTKQCIETHMAHSSECWSLGLNYNHTLAITSGNKNQVKIWDINLDNPDMMKIIEKGMFEKQSKANCHDIKFEQIVKANEVNEIFYLQNNDRTVEMYRIRNDGELQKGIKSRTKRLSEKDYSPEEIKQNLIDNYVSMLITPFQTLRTLAKVRSCNWIKLGKKLSILVSLNNNTIEYYNIQLPENIRKSQEIQLEKSNTIELLGHKTDIRALDISQDDSLLASISNGELKIWNLKTFNVIRNFTLSSGYALCGKFLPGSSLIVIGFKNGNLELYDLAASSLIDQVEAAHENNDINSKDDGAAIWSLDITPDGKTLITGGNDKKTKCWDFVVEQELVPGTNEEVSKLKFHHTQTMELSDEVLCVKVSPNGKLLAMSLLNNNVQVIYLDTMKLFLTLYGHKLPVLSIDISQDNQLIITSSADKNIKIWGLNFGDCHKSIFGHQDSIMTVNFIGDSHNFFSSSKDGVIKYWDGDKFECIQKLIAHQLEVWSLALSKSGLFMVSASHDNSIRLWLATNDQVFLEEEREKEMEEMYEDTLLDSLENDGTTKAKEDEDNENEDENEVSKVSKPTMMTLKAGEKLMDALDIGFEDYNKSETYNHQLHQYETGKTTQKPLKYDVNSVLLAYKLTASDYVLKVLNQIKASELEDSLLILPFSYTKKLIKFIEIWMQQPKLLTVVNISLICRVTFFIIRTNNKELINQRDGELKNQLVNVKHHLRSHLAANSSKISFNNQGLHFIKRQWQLNHESGFEDPQEDIQAKRKFTTLV